MADLPGDLVLLEVGVRDDAGHRHPRILDAVPVRPFAALGPEAIGVEVGVNTVPDSVVGAGQGE